jgi:AcrR family transcriptional regulator
LYTATAAAPETTEDRILAAAERSMERYGLRRVSMNDVAAEAGLSRGSVYRYFPDRDALVDAVLARTAERFVAASKAAVDRGRTLADQVAEGAVFIVRHRRDAELALHLDAERDTLLATLLTARSDYLLEQWVEFWLPRLEQAQARGEVRARLDRRQAAEWIVRMLFSFAVLPSVTVDLADDPAVRTFVTTHLVRGLAPQKGTRG